MVAITGDKVVVRVTIGVAAEATDSTSVGAGDDDTGVAVPVKGDSDTHLSGDEAMDTTERHLELMVVGEGKVQQDTINLDLLGMFLAEAEGHVVHLHGDHLGEGDQAAATVIVLHSDRKGDEGGVSGAEPS